jgi:hypothetical protein
MTRSELTTVCSGLPRAAYRTMADARTLQEIARRAVAARREQPALVP